MSTLVRTLPRTVGLLVVAAVASVHLHTLLEGLEGNLKNENAVFTHPAFYHTILFGTAYAATGDMTVSLLFATLSIYAARYAFVTDRGIADNYFTPAAVKSVRKALGEKVP